MTNNPVTITAGTALTQLLLIKNKIPTHTQEWPHNKSSWGSFGSTGQDFQQIQQTISTIKPSQTQNQTNQTMPN